MKNQNPLAAIDAAITGCTRCPELRSYCAQIAIEKKRAYRDQRYWGKPVPAFGDVQARVMLVGLAPGAHGSNRTGRMFTGDASGSFLYPALFRAGFASGPSAIDRNEELQLHDCIITSTIRCAPPGNKPTPQQIRNCYSYLSAEFDALQTLQVMIPLGSIGFKAALDLLKEKGFGFESRPKFGHGVEVAATRGERNIAILCSFHPSQQNTNTGKLTVPMFDAIFDRAKKLLN